MSQRPKSSPRRQAMQIAAFYLVVGCLWVALSDRTLTLITSDSELYARAQTWKGWFWILATTVFIYILVWRALKGRYRYEEEIRRRDESLLQSQKLEAVGRLAGGVAHDFNNVLMVIQGYAQILRGYCKGDHTAAADLDQIEQACERATHLTRQLLAFSRKRAARPRIIDLNEIIENSDRMLRRLIGEDILVQLELSDRSCPVEADPIQLEQIVMNLAVNARDAMPAGGTLSFRTQRVPASEVPSAKAEGEQVFLEVRDTGQGMAADTMTRIFEPFFTTKSSGQGTGLGLSTVYAIVDQSGGHIAVDSVEGRGAVFSIWFPLSQRPVDKLSGAGFSPPVGTKGETILLVEDEPGVIGLLQSILLDAGYKVLVSQDGQKALELAQEFDGTIHLLLTDVVLPHRSGPALARELAHARSEMRVLFISGYAERDLLGEESQHLPLIEKPASPAEILQAVRETLDGPVASPPSK